MNLKNLIQYQLSEGLTEQELAVDIGVPKLTIHGILKGRDPKSQEVWKKLARYFRMDVNVLALGKFGLANAVGNDEDRASDPKRYRKVPLLAWAEASQVLAHPDSRSFLASRPQRIETELVGARVFALHVNDDSMEPLFHEGEIIFVNPDLHPQTGDYVIVLDPKPVAEQAYLRKLMKGHQREVLHPLNPKYQDTPLTCHKKVIGQVVRLRMDL